MSLAEGRLSSREFTAVWGGLVRAARALCRSGARMGPDGWAACDQPEDLAAEALLRLLAGEPTPTAVSPGQAAVYLRTTVRNLAASWTRGRNGDPGDAARCDPAFTDALGQALSESAEDMVSRRDLVDTALRDLEESVTTGPRLALVARLQFVEGWTDQEIADLPTYDELLIRRQEGAADPLQNVRQDAGRARQRLKEIVARLLRPSR